MCRASATASSGERTPAPLHPDVHFDQDLQPASSGLDCLVERVTVSRIIHRDGEAASPARQGQGLDFILATYLVGDQDVVDARSAHDDAFPDRGRTDADGAGLDLQESQLRAFVNFDVWAKPRVHRLHPLGHESDVVPCKIEIQNQGRRRQIGSRTAHGGRIGSLDVFVKLSNHCHIPLQGPLRRVPQEPHESPVALDFDLTVRCGPNATKVVAEPPARRYRISSATLASVIEVRSYGAGLWVTVQPATAATMAATATPASGIAKLDVCLVSLPTSHIASAPTSEPEPPKRPAAVDTRAGETSWAIVR